MVCNERSGVVRSAITKVYGPVLCSITRSGLYGLLLQRCMVQCYVALQGFNWIETKTKLCRNKV